MKPKEFDELLKQKFEQNDFAYNPANWDRLAEQMDGRAKKRNAFIWLMPALGMAASVALAMGVTNLMRQQAPASNGAGMTAKAYQPQQAQPANSLPAQQVAAPQHELIAANRSTVIYTSGNGNVGNVPGSRNSHNTGTPGNGNGSASLTAAFAAQNNSQPNNSITEQGKTTGTENSNTLNPANTMNFAANNNNGQKAPVKQRKIELVSNEGYNTFREEAQAPKKPANFSIIVSGGLNRGNQASGYAAGATVRKMVSDKVFIESDIAFATSDNVQHTQYMTSDPASATGVATSGKGGAAKSSAVEASKTTTSTLPAGTVKTQDVSYSLYYAQITPSIGYKVAKRMSIAAGPDFQKVLVDNRPATSIVDRGNLQVAPLFDVGFVGKTEFAVNKTVKAGVSYRKGINNVITPTDKYIDRDYLQFQVKCAIFNR